MAKKGKELNPADAHRKKLRKLELKKNKDDKKKKETLQSTHREALRLVEELTMLNRLEKETPLDKANKTKKEKVEKKLDEINESRRAAGLPAVTVSAVAKPKPKTAEEEYKWYHPTFNPHGPKKPKGYKDPKQSGATSTDDSDSDDDSDSASDSDAEMGEALKPLDFANLPLPEGDAPMDAQFYHNLDLPETRLDAPKRPVAPIPMPTPFPAIPIAYPTFPPPPFPFPGGMPPPHFIPGGIPPGMPPPLPFPPGMPPPPPFGFPPGMPPPPFPYPPGMPPPFFPPPPLPHAMPPGPPPTLRYQPGVPFTDPAAIHHNPPPPPPPQHHTHAAAPHFNVAQHVSEPYQNRHRTRDEPAARPAPAPLPAKPAGTAPTGPVVISAEPRMRDLQKELTQFVPRKAKGKVVGPVMPASAVRSGVGRVVVDAAPEVDGGEEGGVGGDGGEWVPADVQVKRGKGKGQEDELEAFMKEIGGE
ncbi:hypothetical protein HDU98_012010 [Podochytrium sp. JEL0797]|nr:hypothetical protein HDU98_012010 [Podochytrium sp. JEL0797]